MAAPVLHLLTGPTACGKTALALEWAERSGAEIICADSTTVYRGMDVGTAKPSAEERSRVPHHLLDVADVFQPFDVSAFAAMARDVVEDIHRRGKPVLVVGGSGFYLRSFHAPISDDVGISPALRAEVVELEKREGLAGLVREVKGLNPGGTGSLDLLNPRRVFNALLRCRASGLTLGELLTRFRSLPEPFPGWEKRFLLLRRPVEELRERAAARTEAMLAAGLIEEVKQLTEMGFECNPAAASAIGYRETLAFLKGGLPRSALAGEISRNTCRLIRKQLAWFRLHLPAHRTMDAGSPLPHSEWFQG